MNFTVEAKEEVLRYLARGEKIAAIKYLCDTFLISVEEAKALVEAAELENSASVPQKPKAVSTTLDGELKSKVIQHLQQRNKIGAVKEVKASLRINLKDALLMVEEVERELDPTAQPIQIRLGGCAGRVFRLVSFVFLTIGLLFMGVAGVVYYLQTETIANGQTVIGKVVELRSGDESGVAPVIAYEWNGQQMHHYSNMYSSPPSYELDEEVPVIVNTLDPRDVLIDTFSDRWLLIVIIGTIGLFFAGFGAIFVFAGRKI